MSTRIVLIGLLALSVCLASVSSSPVRSGATQAPRISVDMVTSGNTYTDSTNGMNVGAIQNCLSTDLPGNNTQHNHTAHLIIQNAEDLEGWQARMNYDGGRMRPSTVNFTPFTDSTTGQNVSFVNLPIEGGVHRDLVTASTIPPLTTGPQTALVGAVYNGAHNAALSPDTPAKSTPDETSYSALGGGILAAINLQVLAGQAGQPSMYVDLDDAVPNSPGSNVVVFTQTGTSTLALTDDSLADGFHGEGVPCLPVILPPQPVQPLPSGPSSPSGAGPSSASPDFDHDGFSDAVENYVGTSFIRPCGTDSWPPDINNSVFSDITDVAVLTGKFGSAVPPGPARANIAPDPPDGFI